MMKYGKETLLMFFGMFLALAMAVCSGASAAVPATRSDLDPDIPSEIRDADSHVTLTDVSIIEGKLKTCPDGGTVFRIALDVPGGEKVYFTLQSEEKVKAVAVREDGSQEKTMASVDPEDEQLWKYEYRLNKYDTGRKTVLIRITGQKTSLFSLTIMTESSAPTPTPAVTPTPTPSPAPDPSVSPAPDPTEAPTEAPTEEPTATPEHDVDPSPTLEPTPPPSRGGGGGYSSGTRVAHSKNKLPQGPDYDHVLLSGIVNQESAPMAQLQLDQEALDLYLLREDGQEGAFTASAVQWGAGSETPDTLVLSSSGAEGEKNIWQFNGAVLRKLSKSGIKHLVLKTGDAILSMETEDVLAGWLYDDLKFRGTAARRFTFTVETAEGLSPAWRVAVEDQEYTLTSGTDSGLYLTGVYGGPAEWLDLPYDEAIKNSIEKEETSP